MKWILFLVILSGDSRGGTAITQHEFPTREACYSAADLLRTYPWNGYSDPNFVQRNFMDARTKCVPAGGGSHGG